MHAMMTAMLATDTLRVCPMALQALGLPTLYYYFYYDACISKAACCGRKRLFGFAPQVSNAGSLGMASTLITEHIAYGCMCLLFLKHPHE
jgi:hypothetical protein